MKYKALAVIVSAALLVGCGGDPSQEEPAAVETLGSAESEEQGEPSAAESEEPVETGVDALEITGPRYADEVADMEAVTTGVTPDLPVTITDSEEKQVTVESASKILTFDLYGTLTDTVIGLGLRDRLVGRSISDTQADLEDLPVVTHGSHDLNTEAVLELDPDLILTNGTIGTPEVYEQLETAGVTVVNFEHVPSLEEIDSTIKQVGEVLGLENEAADLAQHTRTELDAALEQVEAMSSATPRKPRGVVLYVRGTAGVFFILGEDYGASDILDALGLDDVAASAGITNLKPANAEALVSLDPELILAMEHGVESSGGVDGFLERPGLAATTAGANERLVIAGDNQLLAYGPRTPANLIALAEAIYVD